MLKRLFDIIFAGLGLVFLLPIFLMMSLMIKWGSKGPVFYRGQRVGRFGKIFRIYKFRTMIVNAEKIGASSTADDDPRLTKTGKFLRKYKLDELPQLINILKGEMSFVGPRPQVAWAVKLYSQKESALLRLRPGITDFASLEFPNEGEILRNSQNPDKDYLEKIHPEKMRLALQYLKEQSLWTDFKIILKTLKIIWQR